MLNVAANEQRVIEKDVLGVTKSSRRPARGSAFTPSMH
jgi:hypothetical protein